MLGIIFLKSRNFGKTYFVCVRCRRTYVFNKLLWKRVLKSVLILKLSGVTYTNNSFHNTAQKPVKILGRQDLLKFI